MYGNGPYNCPSCNSSYSNCNVYTGLLMLGILGTIGVVSQMAILAVGFDTKIAMLIGLVSCIIWAAHAIKMHDHSLLVTNVMVAGFATWGIM